MNSTGYTLLIVESPTLGRELQKLVPQNIFVIATKGYLWSPLFHKEKLKLGKKAIKEKLGIRNLIREEASSAVRIVIATDSDPAGDFIAWSLSEELKTKKIYRGNLQSLSKRAVEELITCAIPVEHSLLHKRLENRYLIRRLWQQYFQETDMQTAAVVTIFKTPSKFRHFKTEQGIMFSSLSHVECRYGTALEVVHISDEVVYKVDQPLSTFKLLELITAACNYLNYEEAQIALYELFETTDPDTGEGLITYPRTKAASFFRESWETLIQQWIQKHSINEFIPTLLQVISDPYIAHDSIRPSDLNTDPGYIAKHIPSDLGSLYSLIHSYTIKAISIPQIAETTCRISHNGTVLAANEKISDIPSRLSPVLTISDFGHLLSSMDVLRPSGFGSYLTSAHNLGIININSDTEVKPGKKLNQYLHKAEQFGRVLNRLKSAADDPDMDPETISKILTS